MNWFLISWMTASFLVGWNLGFFVGRFVMGRRQ